MKLLFFRKGMICCLALTGMISLWITGCATHSLEKPAVPVPQSSAETFQPEPVGVLSNLEHWDLNALIAIRNAAKSNGDSANLTWQQTQKNYTISLFGPMGSNAVKLYGHPGQVVLEKSNGQTVTAKTPEAMLAKETGWRLPVSNLYYWIRGLPVPNVAAQKNYDQNQHLQVLLQEGWRVQYLDYIKVKGIDLPRKVFLNNPDLNIKIIVSKWEI